MKGQNKTIAVAPLLLLLAAAPTHSQDRSTPIEQIGSVVRVQRVEQLSEPSPSLVEPVRSEMPGSATSQLNREGRSARSPAQLNREGRTAASSTPLSRPADGRTAATERLTGDDRCDPARGDRRASPACLRVLEERAADFRTQEAPVLSAEQRILIEQRRQAEAQDSRTAAKRLATTGEDADSLELQGIASVALRPPPEPVRKPVEEDNAAIDAAQAIVNAIVQGGGTTVAPPK